MAKPSEVGEVILLLKSAYPRQPVTQSTLDVYQLMLADIDVDLLRRAAHHHVATSQYFPSIAELRAEASGGKDLPTAEEAWGEVCAAVRRVGRYRLPPTFSHPLIHDAVSAIGWNTITDSETVGVERAHFFRIFEAFANRLSRDRAIAGTPLARAAEPKKLGTGAKR